MRNFRTKYRKKRFYQISNLLFPILGSVGSALLTTDINTENVFDDPYVKIIEPAGITFAIWGPIFALLGIYLVYQARDLFTSFNNDDMDYIFEVGPFFILSTISAITWYILWARRLILESAITMVIYLILILIAYSRLNINLKYNSRKERFYITSGWSMYAGWVTVAVFVSLSTWLKAINFVEAINIGNEEIWSIIVLVMIITVYLVTLLKRKDVIFYCVGIWALIGIIIEELANPNIIIITVSITGLLFLIASLGLWKITSEKSRKKGDS